MTDWLREKSDRVLSISAGPHGDGRFETAGDLLRHMFSAEKRYVDRLSNQPLTDTGMLFRLNALAIEFHDFLFSPVLGGEFKRPTN